VIILGRVSGAERSCPFPLTSSLNPPKIKGDPLGRPLKYWTRHAPRHQGRANLALPFVLKTIDAGWPPARAWALEIYRQSPEKAALSNTVFAPRMPYASWSNSKLLHPAPLGVFGEKLFYRLIHCLAQSPGLPGVKEIDRQSQQQPQPQTPPGSRRHREHQAQAD